MLSDRIHDLYNQQIELPKASPARSLAEPVILMSTHVVCPLNASLTRSYRPVHSEHMATMWQLAARLNLCHIPIRFRHYRPSQRCSPRSTGAIILADKACPQSLSTCRARDLFMQVHGLLKNMYQLSPTMFTAQQQPQQVTSHRQAQCFMLLGDLVSFICSQNRFFCAAQILNSSPTQLYQTRWLSLPS